MASAIEGKFVYVADPETGKESMKICIDVFNTPSGLVVLVKENDGHLSQVPIEQVRLME